MNFFDSEMAKKGITFFVSWLGLFFVLVPDLIMAQGALVEYPAGSTPASWGYIEYLPQDYDANPSKLFPVIIHLSGSGEAGNGSSDLHKVTRHGPLNLVKSGKWPVPNESGRIPGENFIIIGPQSPGGFYNSGKLKNLIEYTIDHYRADPDRIYVMGLSSGAFSVFRLLADYPDLVAAAIPIAGNGARTTDKACLYRNVPIWAFHGEADGTVAVNGSILPVNAVNACLPKPNVKAKLTIYPGVGHNSWSRTYSLSGMGQGDADWDAFDMSIYDWLLQHRRGSDPAPSPVPEPVADAGGDITIDLPQNSAELNGSGSVQGGSIVSYTWTKIAGPSQYTIAGQDKAQATVSDLVAGSYTFRLTVVDDQNRSASDHMSLVVNEETNLPPLADAGDNIAITLPDNSVTLNGSATDNDGVVTSYSWNQVAGPVCNLSNADQPDAQVNDLSEGLYSFELTVTDDDGATANDILDVEVSSAQSENGEYYRIQIVSNKKMLQVNLTLGTEDNSSSQVWEKIEWADGWFKLATKTTGELLTAQSGYQVSLSGNAAGDAALWKLVPTRGGYRIENKSFQVWLRGNKRNNSVETGTLNLQGSWTKWLFIPENNGSNARIASKRELSDPLEENETDFRLYPNPATTAINFTVPSHFEEPSFTIFDLSGHVVLEGSVVALNGAREIPVANLQSGTYVFKLVDNRNGEVLNKIWMKR